MLAWFAGIVGACWGQSIETLMLPPTLTPAIAGAQGPLVDALADTALVLGVVDAGAGSCGA